MKVLIKIMNAKSFISATAQKYHASPNLKISINVLLVVFGVITGVITTYLTWKSANASPTNIKGYYSKAEFPDVVAYSGEIRNEDEENADDLAFKSTFQLHVDKFEVTTPDFIEKKEVNQPPGVVQFVLKRLSSGSQCEFEILVAKGNERKGDMQISWTGGKKVLELTEMDRSFQRGIELSNAVQSLSLSRNARNKWIDNNSKKVGVIK